MAGIRPGALVVDDERINLLIFNKMLSSFGVDSSNASDGYECLQMCAKKRFDYIFLDISMPRLDGFETLKRLRLNFQDRGIDIPIICITGETDSGRRKEILDAGFTDIMSKPINKRSWRECSFSTLPRERLF